jgi:site-specific recombinase XerD
MPDGDQLAFDQASPTEATSGLCRNQELYPPAILTPSQTEGGDMDQLLSLISRLSSSKQRLVRELVWNLAQLERLTIPEDHDARLDYGSFMDTWLKSLIARGFAAETLRRYRRSIVNLLTTHPHPTQAHIEFELARFTSAGRTPGTVTRMLEAYRSFFAYLSNTGLTTTNPVGKVPTPRQEERLRRPASEEQVIALLTGTRTVRHSAMVHLLIDCGIRVTELATATINGTDTSSRQITVLGKGRKMRKVPMSERTAQLLQQQINQLREVNYKGDWLFPGRYPDSHIAADAIRDYIYRVCDAAGIERVSPHRLRHYFATAILRSGANLKAVSAMLGHVKTSTTVNTYWHIINEEEITLQHDKYSPLKGISYAEKMGE